jgi:hypothetical protein
MEESNEAKAYCHRCERSWTVLVNAQDYATGICFDECECGKAGQFGLLDESCDVAN